MEMRHLVLIRYAVEEVLFLLHSLLLDLALLLLFAPVGKLKDANEGHLLIQLESVNVLIVELDDGRSLIFRNFSLIRINASCLQDLTHPIVQIRGRNAEHISSLLHQVRIFLEVGSALIDLLILLAELREVLVYHAASLWSLSWLPRRITVLAHRWRGFGLEVGDEELLLVLILDHAIEPDQLMVQLGKVLGR